MGTRSTVKFYNEFSEKPMVCIYQQYDGYISGVGYDLANWLKDKTVINGFSGHKMEDGFANGMSCLAAQYIAHNKTEIGGGYIHDLDDEEEYNYHIKLIGGEIIIEVGEFKGTPEELLKYEE